MYEPNHSTPPEAFATEKHMFTRIRGIGGSGFFCFKRRLIRTDLDWVPMSTLGCARVSGLRPEFQEKLRGVMGAAPTKRRAASYGHDSSWPYVSHPVRDMTTLTVDVGVDVAVNIAVGIALVLRVDEQAVNARACIVCNFTFAHLEAQAQIERRFYLVNI